MEAGRMRSVVCLVLVASCGVVVQAHHSIAGMYDGARRVTVDGTVGQFQFVNPHPFVIVDVKDAAGTVQQWRLELDNRRELVDVGITAQTFSVGDRLIVTGSPARTQMRGLYVWSLQRPADGFLYEQIGSSPRVRRLSPGKSD
jgi:hypothetical protein